MLKYRYDIYTEKNSRADDKPNEDIAYINENIGIGLVLDGVSRDREDGIYPTPSPAAEASQLFMYAAVLTAKTKKEAGLGKIQSMIISGNDSLRKYNDKLKHCFPAGTVGVVFSVEDEQFYYGYIGDCSAAIIRNGTMRVFTECQTAMVARYKKRYTSDEIRYDICNHVSHPCGYGVWNGSIGAMDFVEYGGIRVQAGDVLLIYTDGMNDVIEANQVAELMNKPLCMLCKEEDKNQDDKTCIRIVFDG